MNDVSSSPLFSMTTYSFHHYNPDLLKTFPVLSDLDRECQDIPKFEFLLYQLQCNVSHSNPDSQLAYSRAMQAWLENVFEEKSIIFRTFMRTLDYYLESPTLKSVWELDNVGRCPKTVWTELRSFMEDFDNAYYTLSLKCGTRHEIQAWVKEFNNSPIGEDLTIVHDLGSKVQKTLKQFNHVYWLCQFLDM